MKKLILNISAKMGNTLNFCVAYPNHLNNRFQKNEKLQLKVLTTSLFYLFAFYIYLGYYNTNIYLSSFFFICSVCFFGFTILFLGMLISRLNPNTKFPLIQFKSKKNADNFIFISEPSAFLSKNYPKDNYTVSEINHKKEKLDSKINLISDHFSSYFFEYEIFNQVSSLLIKNKFYGNNIYPKPLEISLLIYKLNSLKIIDCYRKQGKICKSSAKFFNVNEYNESNISVIFTNFKNETVDNKHLDFLKELGYLNHLSNRI